MLGAAWAVDLNADQRFLLDPAESQSNVDSSVIFELLAITYEPVQDDVFYYSWREGTAQ